MRKPKIEAEHAPAPTAGDETPGVEIVADDFLALPEGIALGTIHIEINGVAHHITIGRATSKQLKVLYDHSADFAKFIKAPAGYVAPLSAADNQVITGGCNGC